MRGVDVQLHQTRYAPNMATWSEVQSFAREKFALADDEPEYFKILLQFPDGRGQAVVVSTYDAMGQSWCDFSSAACTREHLDPEEALKENYRLAAGALCLDEDVYVVRYCLRLEDLCVERFELPLHIVASAADTIEKRVTGGADGF